MEVAVKVISKANLTPEQFKQVEREVEIHARLQHCGVIDLYAAFDTASAVYLLLEYAPGGTLYSFLKAAGSRLTEAQTARRVVRPVLSVLHYLHRNGIVHRDIKPENMVIAADDKLKLIDFGLAVDVKRAACCVRHGTLDFMAPEVVRMAPGTGGAGAVTPAVDVWAVGVLTYELLTGRPPFWGPSPRDTAANICDKPAACPSWLSAQARHFIASALAKRPEARPAVDSLCCHAWVALPRRCQARAAAAPCAPPAALPLAEDEAALQSGSVSSARSSGTNERAEPDRGTGPAEEGRGHCGRGDQVEPQVGFGTARLEESQVALLPAWTLGVTTGAPSVICTAERWGRPMLAPQPSGLPPPPPPHDALPQPPPQPPPPPQRMRSCLTSELQAAAAAAAQHVAAGAPEQMGRACTGKAERARSLAVQAARRQPPYAFRVARERTALQPRRPVHGLVQRVVPQSSHRVRGPAAAALPQLRAATAKPTAEQPPEPARRGRSAAARRAAGGWQDSVADRPPWMAEECAPAPQQSCAEAAAPAIASKQTEPLAGGKPAGVAAAAKMGAARRQSAGAGGSSPAPDGGDIATAGGGRPAAQDIAVPASSNVVADSAWAEDAHLARSTSPSCAPADLQAVSCKQRGTMGKGAESAKADVTMMQLAPSSKAQEKRALWQRCRRAVIRAAAAPQPPLREPAASVC